MNKFALYRSIVEKQDGKSLHFKHKSTMRPPSNIPYIVDNLWEWARPEEMPCRRKAAYASPSPELAIQAGKDGGTVFQVQFLGEVKIAQLIGYSDSKEHPDCNKLKKFMNDLFCKESGEWWPDWSIEKKQKNCLLWLPCLRKEEVEHIFSTIPFLHENRKSILSHITYWNDVQFINIDQDCFPDKNGEIFFEAQEYRLLSTKEYAINKLLNNLFDKF